MFLLETHIASELREVVDRVRRTGGRLPHLSAVTVGEIQAGIELTRERDPAKADEIEAWLAQVRAACNVLPMDAAAFRTWARLMHRRSDPLLEHAMIATTALVHRLTVVTCNVGDFKHFGVGMLNPFA